MQNNRTIAYILIGIGILFLISKISFDAGWLWVGLVAIGFLWGYISQKSYGLLVTGSILTGVAVGILLQESWGLEGSFLISLGIGFYAIDRVEPRKNHWPSYVAAILATLGLVVGLIESEISTWFALGLIGLGIYLIAFRKERPKSIPKREKAETINPPQSEVEKDHIQPEATEQESISDIPKPEIPSIDQTLLEALTKWRTHTAEAEERAQHLILGDESLRQIAELKPQTLADLRKVKGIGPVKLGRYGEGILSIIKEH